MLFPPPNTRTSLHHVHGVYMVCPLRGIVFAARYEGKNRAFAVANLGLQGRGSAGENTVPGGLKNKNTVSGHTCNCG